MFGKKKEPLPEPPEPPTEVVSVKGSGAKLGQAAPKAPTMQEALIAQYQMDYAGICEVEELSLLFAIYAELRLNRDILAQILAKK